MKSISLEQKFKHTRNVAWRIIEGEAFLINLNDSMCHQINNVGSLIWQSIDGKRKLKEIVSIIVSEFEVDEEKAKADLIDFIKILQQKNLIEIN